MLCSINYVNSVFVFGWITHNISLSFTPLDTYGGMIFELKRNPMQSDQGEVVEELQYYKIYHDTNNPVKC